MKLDEKNEIIDKYLKNNLPEKKILTFMDFFSSDQTS